jgi:hypothetical protein
MHFATECMLLQVEEPGRPLYIGQRLGAFHLFPLEHLARAERPLELFDELFQVVLQNTVKIDQLTVDIVEDLSLCRHRAHEEKRGAAGEDFDITLVFGEKG